MDCGLGGGGVLISILTNFGICIRGFRPNQSCYRSIIASCDSKASKKERSLLRYKQWFELRVSGSRPLSMLTEILDELSTHVSNGWKDGLSFRLLNEFFTWCLLSCWRQWKGKCLTSLKKFGRIFSVLSYNETTHIMFYLCSFIVSWNKRTKKGKLNDYSNPIFIGVGELFNNFMQWTALSITS